MLAKDNAFSISRQNDVINVVGSIDFNNAPDACKQGAKLISDSKLNELKINFSELAFANSVLLAVLCSWLRLANKLNINLKFSGFDKRMHDLFELCGFSAVYLDHAES